MISPSGFGLSGADDGNGNFRFVLDPLAVRMSRRRRLGRRSFVFRTALRFGPPQEEGPLPARLRPVPHLLLRRRADVIQQKQSGRIGPADQRRRINVLLRATDQVTESGILLAGTLRPDIGQDRLGSDGQIGGHLAGFDDRLQMDRVDVAEAVTASVESSASVATASARPRSATVRHVLRQIGSLLLVVTRSRQVLLIVTFRSGIVRVALTRLPAEFFIIGRWAWIGQGSPLLGSTPDPPTSQSALCFAQSHSSARQLDLFLNNKTKS
jgi:hypothetical protein